QEYLNKYKVPAEEWLATATMFTARSIAKSVDKYTIEKTDLIIGGGGSHNPTLVQMIKEALPEISVIRQEDLDIASDAKEAVAMVILGNQTLHRQRSNVPSATGASNPVILGSVTFSEQN